MSKHGMNLKFTNMFAQLAIHIFCVDDTSAFSETWFYQI